MSFPKAWKNKASGGTPITAEALIDLEERTSSDAQEHSIPLVQKGAAGGVGTLDTEGHLTGTQVPPSVETGSRRRVTAPISKVPGQFSAAGVYQPAISRVLFRPPVSTTRWRLRISNYSAYTESGPPGTGGVGNLTQLLLGTPNLTGEARWTGTLTSNATPIWSGSLPIDMTKAVDTVTPWVEDASNQFHRGIPRVICIGYTGSAASEVVYISAGGFSAKTADTNAGQAAAPTDKLVLFDWRIEYEYEALNSAHQPIVVAIGDSITEGFVGQTGLSADMHETWVGAAGLRCGYPTINLGIRSAFSSGEGALSFDPRYSAGTWKWKRVDLATEVPDIAILALGTNDLGLTAVQYKEATTRIIEYVRATLGIPRIYLNTIIPRDVLEHEAVRLENNEWIRSNPAGVSGICDMDRAIALQASSNPVTGDPVFINEYPHPTLAGYQRMSREAIFAT